MSHAKLGHIISEARTTLSGYPAQSTLQPPVSNMRGHSDTTSDDEQEEEYRSREQLISYRSPYLSYVNGGSRDGSDRLMVGGTRGMPGIRGGQSEGEDELESSEDEEEDGRGTPGSEVSRGARELSMNSFDSRIVKPVVTTSLMKKASEIRRTRTPSFKCPMCDDTFTTNFSRKRHINSHTKSQTYTCGEPDCGRTFRNASDRTRHEKRQHNRYNG